MTQNSDCVKVGCDSRISNRIKLMLNAMLNGTVSLEPASGAAVIVSRLKTHNGTCSPEPLR